MISKEMFCRAMNAIQEEWNKKKSLEKALEEHLLDGWTTVKNSPCYLAMIDLLKELFCDNSEYSMIEWWLFDHVDKFVYNADKTIYKDLTKVEDLYDYLMENLKEGE